jgi:NhaP-type Na+/H+ and K+/H+ antiporter
LVFLLIGLKVDFPAMMNNWQAILWAIGAVLFARVIVVYGLGWVANRWSEPISLRWRHVLAWGGMRGALSLALALSLPAVLGEDRQLLLTMAFAVVLFTLLIQATTMQPLLARLRINIRNPVQTEYEIRQAELAASRAAEAHLERRYREGLVSAHVWEALKPKMQEQNAHLARSVREILTSEPALETEEEEIARREILRAKRSAYHGLRRDGVISEEAFNILTARVDSALFEEPVKPRRLNQDAGEEKEDVGADNSIEMRELVVEPGSRSEGRRIRYIPWPEDFVIASVKHGKSTVVPKADTVLRAGDILVVYACIESFRAARELCQTSQT